MPGAYRNIDQQRNQIPLPDFFDLGLQVSNGIVALDPSYHDASSISWCKRTEPLRVNFRQRARAGRGHPQSSR